MMKHQRMTRRLAMPLALSCQLVSLVWAISSLRGDEDSGIGATLAVALESAVALTQHDPRVIGEREAVCRCTGLRSALCLCLMTF